jgi:hypothetical protein
MEAPLTDEQFDRLKRCADGNTLRFESSAIVAALVAGGYAKEGIARVFFCTLIGRRVMMLHSFIKKTQKTTDDELALARKRMKKFGH